VIESAGMDVQELYYEPKLILPRGAVAPDIFKPEMGYPGHDFVVSRNRDGSIASVFTDTEWNWTCYNSNGKPVFLRFGTWCGEVPSKNQRKIIEEMQWILFTLIWLRDGKPLSFGTLNHYVKLMVKMAKYVDKNCCQLHQIFSDSTNIIKFLRESGDYYSKSLSSLIGKLAALGEKKVGFPLPKSCVRREIQRIKKQYDLTINQHPPIPTQIFTEIIRQLGNELDRFEEVSEQYFKLVIDCVKDPLLGRDETSQYKIVKKEGITRHSMEQMRPDMPELLKVYGLRDYFKLKGLNPSLAGLANGLTRIQICAKLYIHAFSGMRSGETRELPYYCIEEFRKGNRVHHLVAGITTKYNDGRIKRTRWVTSKEGARAVCVAQRIACTIYEVLGKKPRNIKSKINKYVLFVSTGYLPFIGTMSISGKEKFLTGGLELADHPQLMAQLGPIINEQDIEELEGIDPHRPWRTEKYYQVGSNWRLTTHQFRRSLALFATKSGLVSLPSLRRQLQHITEEMTIYYARGSNYAKNIIDGKEHFGSEYQNTQPESEALGYIKNILLSDERLFGGHGAWVEQHHRNLSHIVSTMDYDETMKRFAKGEMAFRDTLYGGCTQIEPCNKSAMRSLVSCMDCGRSVIKVSKLNRVIAAQEKLVSEIERNTVEWRAEKNDLISLKNTRDKLERRGAR